MNKMTIIELLNKLANGEEFPMKIKLNNEIYNYTNDDYKTVNEKWLFSESYTDKTAWLDDFLKLEIEIIEEDKPRIEPFKSEYTQGSIETDIINKLQEVIKCINDMEKER